jgi:cell division protein ZapA (FtsZ GTPase activity inhibitor)
VKQTITVDIGGTKFRLVADADEKHLQQLAAMVNERVNQLSSGASGASNAQVLALVALGLADDLHASQQRAKHIEQLTRDAVGNAIARIDQHIASDANG